MRERERESERERAREGEREGESGRECGACERERERESELIQSATPPERLAVIASFLSTRMQSLRGAPGCNSVPVTIVGSVPV